MSDRPSSPSTEAVLYLRSTAAWMLAHFETVGHCKVLNLLKKIVIYRFLSIFFSPKDKLRVLYQDLNLVAIMANG